MSGLAEGRRLGGRDGAAAVVVRAVSPGAERRQDGVSGESWGGSRSLWQSRSQSQSREAGDATLMNSRRKSRLDRRRRE